MDRHHGSSCSRLYYYTLNIDGAEVSDAGTQAYFGGSRPASAVEVPEPGSTDYSTQDVPHGQVSEVWYNSKVTGTWRHALVYLPPNYDVQTRFAIRCSISSTAEARMKRDGFGRRTPTLSSTI